MKTLFSTLSVALLISCGNQPQETPILEVYTNENIYFVDLQGMAISNEINDEVKTFENAHELKTYLAEQTAKDVEPFHTCTDPTHTNCDGECECDGLGCHNRDFE